MGQIWEILHKPETVVFFDIDGTLTSYNYGDHHAHHELDFTPEFRDVNIYADCKRLKPLYEYIKGHNVNRLYCISREPHGHEDWKSEMVERLYGIPASHCFYTIDACEKPKIVMDKVNELFPGIDPMSVVLMDDNDETLGLYMKETPFCTAHPMIFMENMGDENVEYYDENADSFFAGSVNADMSYERDKFISLLPEHARILDAGCGSGRDSKAFLDAGYEVTAFDASKEMRKRASEYLGQEVLDMRFEDIAFDNEFDGVWACASLLHVELEQLPEVMKKLNISLKSGGVIYASFKYGDGTKMRGTRRFSDFNEKSIVTLFEDAGFEIVFNETGNDNRPGRADEMWVNAIGRKKS